MLTMDYQNDKAQRFRELLKRKPESGEVLSSQDGTPVQVHVQENEITGQYIMFVNAAIDDDGKGWFLKDGVIGLKCLIAPSSQYYLLEKYDTISHMFVSNLKVVRHNKKGTALVCEILR